MMTTKTKRGQEWATLLNELANQIEKWSLARQWKVERREEERTEPAIGEYTVPVLEMSVPDSHGRQIVLDPKAYETAGSHGRVDLYAYPTLFRVKLLHQPGNQPEED